MFLAIDFVFCPGTILGTPLHCQLKKRRKGNLHLPYEYGLYYTNHRTLKNQKICNNFILNEDKSLEDYFYINIFFIIIIIIIIIIITR